MQRRFFCRKRFRQTGTGKGRCVVRDFFGHPIDDGDGIVEPAKQIERRETEPCDAASPVASPPDSGGHDESITERPEATPAKWVLPLAPYLTSLAVHALIFLVLAAWVLPILTQGIDIPPISAAFNPKLNADQSAVETAFNVALSSGATSNFDNIAATATSIRNPTAATTPVSMPGPTEPRVLEPAVPSPARMSDKELSEQLPVSMAAMPMHRHRGETRVEEAEDTSRIAGSLQGDLKSIAKDGDAVVVWMLDQSLSMQLDMKSLAQQLSATLQEIEADKSTNIQHYVVAFGDKVSVVQQATDNGLRVARAIYNLPPDPSGIENTFQSVEWCIDNLFNAKRWFYGKPRQRLLVVWTDESGDDYLNLERVTQRCLKSHVRVDIIGPSAVLGAQTGYTAYLHPADGRTYQLPVHRGPDSSFPQKLSLGYWYRGVPTGYNESFRGPWPGTSPNWHGGSNLASMLSGFSPYALTRLARQTGGRYIIYDRPGDRAPFRLDEIREYMPDYRSIAEIQFEMRRQPLRQLVLAASAITWQSGWTRLSEPLMTIRPMSGGESGRQFRTQTMPLRLKNPVATAHLMAADVEHALSIYARAATAAGFEPSQAYDRTEADIEDPSAMVKASPKPSPERQVPAGDDKAIVGLPGLDTPVNESLLEQLYNEEPSKRWRAWCNLNMGRLLAISVRLREYLIATDMLLRNRHQLNPDTNHVQLLPAVSLRGGQISEERARIARKLLQRCVNDNPGTPWAIMAERELRDSLGLSFQERFIPTPPPRPPTIPSPPPTRPTLPRL